MKKTLLMWSFLLMTMMAFLTGCGREESVPGKAVTELTAEERREEMAKLLEEAEAGLHDETLTPEERREKFQKFLIRYHDYRDDPLYLEAQKKLKKTF